VCLEDFPDRNTSAAQMTYSQSNHTMLVTKMLVIFTSYDTMYIADFQSFHRYCSCYFFCK